MYGLRQGLGLITKAGTSSKGKLLVGDKRRCFMHSSSNGGEKSSSSSLLPVTRELLPLFMMVSLALGLGVATMYRHMVHSPTVAVSKRAREALLEVEDPTHVATMGKEFVIHSPLRKISTLNTKEYK